MTVQIMRDFGVGDGQLFIGGRWVDAAGKDRRTVANPKDGSTVAAVAEGTTEDVDRAVAAARKAQPAWQATTVVERAALLNRLAGLIEDNTETLAGLLTSEAARLFPNRASTPASPRCCCAMRPRAGGTSRARSCPARTGTSRSGSSACPMAWWPASPPGTFRPRCSPARSGRRWSPATRSSSSRTNSRR